MRQVSLHASFGLQFLVLGNDTVAVGGVAQFSTVAEEHGERAIFRGGMCACPLSVGDPSLSWIVLSLTIVVFGAKEKVASIGVRGVREPIPLDFVNDEMVFLAKIDMALLGRVLL